MTLPISDWLFYLEGGTYSAILVSPHSQVIAENGLSISIVFGETQKWHLFMTTVTPATPAMAGELAISYEELKKKVEEVQHQLETVQLQSRFGFQCIAGSDKNIRFCTRFASHKHFLAFWQLVEPAATNKMVKITKTKAASPSFEELNQTKATKLVCGPLRDLAERFGIRRTKASRLSVLSTCGYQRKKSKLSYPDTQEVLNCAELYCQTPSSLLLQSEVFSNYKSHTTLKAMIGIAPHGAITFVSGLYAGSMSDRELFELPGIFKCFTPDMAIMVNKGFLADDLVPCKVKEFPDVQTGCSAVELCICQESGDTIHITIQGLRYNIL